ncbi:MULTISPECIES: flagellar hook-length control protein FliK [unclassified Paracoccus (in: a-proteobacteria)]|uniref:flagellar hook-length control protein FliK n=1 Tax=unclassified Paracoccus (in: a-proteobacteria) TaxID=2688777 RepID=UPI001602434D|nr:MULTISPECIES: flagellar hook-length control protein FliK [unclassified Paracoccus (in: a-proteobacteria)]MBB1491722.1 flagellar hook-length control protein FliK [Paracoccus sp. MC1854]MBB1499671.1 flagellar hook-length control protein FliK [Paracoccus sp. MC1862]QQO44853.1 flagellar hook-length control protein FliK [Paracoccus sp. MC1862]
MQVQSHNWPVACPPALASGGGKPAAAEGGLFEAVLDAPDCEPPPPGTTPKEPATEPSSAAGNEEPAEDEPDVPAGSEACGMTLPPAVNEALPRGRAADAAQAALSEEGASPGSVSGLPAPGPVPQQDRAPPSQFDSDRQKQGAASFDEASRPQTVERLETQVQPGARRPRPADVGPRAVFSPAEGIGPDNAPEGTASPVPSASPRPPGAEAPPPAPSPDAITLPPETLQPSDTRLPEALVPPAEIREAPLRIAEAPALHRPPPAEPHRQIADAIVRTRDGQVELILNPVELGRVTVLLGTEGNPGHLAMFVERPETLDLIRRHGEQLLRELRDGGMSDPSLDILQQDSHDSPQDRNRRSGENRAAAGLRIPEGLQEAAPCAVPLSRLDIRL